MSQKAIHQAIKKHKTFLISTHVNPDPDALASELAMALYLKALGKKVHVVNTDPVPSRFQFLPTIEMVKEYKDGQTLDYDVAIVLDCGDLHRIEKVKNLILKGKVLVNFDHHLTNDHFGTLNLIRPQASSTAEVLFDFLKYAKARLNREMAQLLYLGVMTDTGSFRYDSTTVHTHKVAGELMKFDFSVSELYRRIYERVTFEDLRLFTKVINRFETLYKGRVVCIELKKNILKKFSEEFDVRDKVFTFLRAIRGVEVIIIYSDHTPKQTRVNFRSQGNRVNVAQLAYVFGGGGHRKASGCMVSGNISEARKKVLTELDKIL